MRVRFYLLGDVVLAVLGLLAAAPVIFARPMAPNVDFGPPGVSITDLHQRYEVRARVHVHLDGRWFDSERMAGVDTLLFRRAVINVEGTAGKLYAFRLMPDFALAKTSFPEAYVTVRPSRAFNVLVGKTKSPFDVERLVSHTDLLFVE